MKPRARPISNLYHRWGVGYGFKALEIAELFETAGLIELSPERTHYFETDKARNLPPYNFHATFIDILIGELARRNGDTYGNQ